MSSQRKAEAFHDFVVIFGSGCIQAVGLAQRKNSGNLQHRSQCVRCQLYASSCDLQTDIVNDVGRLNVSPTANQRMISSQAATPRGTIAEIVNPLDIGRDSASRKGI